MERSGSCKKCGHTRFSEGVLGKSGYDKVRNPSKMFGGSNLLLLFCESCGEVASLRVERPDKIKD
ncbi:hypothetical protein [Priestia taiwanensis]|uniref:Uncharacterized protein n=1 Tax=Priestia taiwanensis TaxID=1347902 RepID=A0A917AWT3_9BACI|nr:hypothetical protein [Priestia taiwanensis]MBM7365041.1 putative Zn finger protein [Priestia taiwanensis]GGE83592.1 hypothetical protein GCM10007140_36400 [Priestia taiwanensis]